jgi:hypothetical protein
VRDWVNGRRRAPAWFIAVLRAELSAQIDKRQTIIAELDKIETGDRRKGPQASARGRAHRERQLAAKRAQEALNEDSGPKNDPHS